jgi:tRNA threonylcarbamoyladenosine biosynthesis protein TsaE
MSGDAPHRRAQDDRAQREPAAGRGTRAQTVFSMSEDETFEFGRALARRLRGGETVLLEGPLGSGKTVLARGLAVGLGVPAEEVSSPSYVLVHEYHGGRLALFHVDLYRLEDPAEIETLGLEDLGSPVAVVVVEWGERLPAIFARAPVRIRLTDLGEGTRRIELLDPAAPRADA